jgi:hypothetical protein
MSEVILVTRSSAALIWESIALPSPKSLFTVAFVWSTAYFAAFGIALKFLENYPIS